MRIVSKLKKWSIIMSALLLVTGLVVPASSWAAGNSTGNITSQGAIYSYSQGTTPIGAPLSFENFNFNANSSQISSMSLLDRMWRNAHFYDTMSTAYEGMTAMPAWILPTEYTKSAITMHDWSEVNNVALNYTQPGTYLTPRWWSLE